MSSVSQVYVVVSNETATTEVYKSKEDLIKMLKTNGYNKPYYSEELNDFINKEEDFPVNSGGLPFYKDDIMLKYIVRANYFHST